MIEKSRLGAVLRAVRHHRGETQDDVGRRAHVERTKVAQVELGTNQCSTSAARRWVAAGWQVDRAVIDALADGEATVEGAAEAFAVPVHVVADALREPAHVEAP